jgi:hypothetical protein
MYVAKKKEIQGLIDRGTFLPIHRKYLPHNANVISARFVLGIKNG